MGSRMKACLSDVPAFITSCLLLVVLGILLAAASVLKTTWDIILGALIGLIFAQSVASQDWKAFRAPPQRTQAHEQWEMLEEDTEQRAATRNSTRAKSSSHSLWSLACWRRPPRGADDPPTTPPKASRQPHWFLLILSAILWTLTCGAYTISYGATLRDRHGYWYHHQLHHTRSSWSLLDSNVSSSEITGTHVALLSTLLALEWIIAAVLLSRVGMAAQHRKGHRRRTGRRC